MDNAPPPLPERPLHLWLVAAAPVIWIVHFFVSYATAAIWCAKFAGRDGSLGTVRTTILWYTAAALPAIVVFGWNGWRKHRFGHRSEPHDADTPEDRHRFLGLATALLAALSALATLMVAWSATVFQRCW